MIGVEVLIVVVIEVSVGDAVRGMLEMLLGAC